MIKQTLTISNSHLPVNINTYLYQLTIGHKHSIELVRYASESNQGD